MCDYCEMMDDEGIATADEKKGMHVLQYLFTDLADEGCEVDAFKLDADDLYELISEHHTELDVRCAGDGDCFASEQAPLIGTTADLAAVLDEYKSRNSAQESYDAAKTVALEMLNRDGFCAGEHGSQGRVSGWKNMYAQVDC